MYTNKYLAENLRMLRPKSSQLILKKLLLLCIYLLIKQSTLITSYKLRMSTTKCYSVGTIIKQCLAIKIIDSTLNSSYKLRITQNLDGRFPDHFYRFEIKGLIKKSLKYHSKNYLQKINFFAKLEEHGHVPLKF